MVEVHERPQPARTAGDGLGGGNGVELTRRAIRAARASVITASLLGGMKLVAAIFTGSLALAASFVDSLMDVTLNVGGTAFGSNGGMYTVAAVTIPVPEPETWAMLLVGLGLVGMRLRQKAAATAL